MDDPTTLEVLRQEAITAGWEAYMEADTYFVSDVEAAMIATFDAGVAVGRQQAASAIRNAGGAFPDVRRQCANLAEHGTVDDLASQRP